MTVKQKIYWDLEPDFVFDYIKFSANLRFFQSQENSYKNFMMRDARKAICLVNLLEIYQKSLEDLAAVTLGFYRRFNGHTICTNHKKANTCKDKKIFKDEKTPLIYSLINYTPGEATLLKILDCLGDDSTKIIEGLGIKSIEGINLFLLYPTFDIQKFYTCVVSSLRDLGADQEKRIKIFNKIKHGGVVVFDGQHFSSTLPHSPAVVYAHPEAFSSTGKYPIF